MRRKLFLEKCINKYINKDLKLLFLEEGKWKTKY